jgi:transcriptional regulator with XRE-family HTH domain
MPKVEITVAFAAVLKKYRLAKGMSQEKLAEKANIHPTHVGLLERALRNPSVKVSKAIADALGVPLSKIIAEAEHIVTPKKK